MSQIAYLVEPVRISSTGTISGKSLRTYEVVIENVTNKYGRTEVRPIPTGKLFTLKNNQIVQSKTSASLASKYIGWGVSSIYTDIKSIPSYRSQLFSTPELAILSKVITLNSTANSLKRDAENRLHDANKIIESLPDTTSFTSQYPELLI